MLCPNCGFSESRVVDSRAAEEGQVIRRRRECEKCKNRFTTYERIEERSLVVKKSDGSSEPYNRQKLFRGLLTACAKRPIQSSQLESLIRSIETELRTNQQYEVSSKVIGEMALTRLAQLDDVAFIRFASVYKDFKDANEFARAIKGLS